VRRLSSSAVISRTKSAQIDKRANFNRIICRIVHFSPKSGTMGKEQNAGDRIAGKEESGLKNNSYALGIAIMALGIVILLGKLGVFSFIGSTLWPLFVLLPGLLLHALFFNRMLPSIALIPAGILTFTALLFFYCNIFGWRSMSYLWPGFILAVSLGFYEYYLFDANRPRGALVTAVILAAVAAAFFVFMLMFTAMIYFLAVVLIAVGAYLLFRRPSAW
jgi:hypothetical protein